MNYQSSLGLVVPLVGILLDIFVVLLGLSVTPLPLAPRPSKPRAAQGPTAAAAAVALEARAGPFCGQPLGNQ